MNQPRPDFAEIKKTTDIAQVVESYGIELKPSSRGDWKGLCPFHDDTKPSMVVTPAKGLFHCMACGAAGNVIQFVAKKEGIEEREAALRLLDAVPGVSRGSEITAEGKKAEVNPLADPELFAVILEHYQQALFGKDKRGLDYLKRRNLAETEALQHFKIGFVDGTLKEKLSAAQLEKAKALGLINAKGNEKFYNRIVIPIFDANGNAVGLYGRDITGKSEVKHLYLAGGHRAVWNAQAATVYPDELICAESVFDALAIWMHGGKRNVIAAYGARGFTPHHTELLEKSATRKLVFAFDADETGQERARELATELKEKLNLTCHRIKWPDHAKDANDYFLHNAEADFKGNAESFSSLLTAAPRIGFKKADSAKLTLLEQTEEAAIFQNGSVNYKVRGGMGGVGNMKVIVTATSAEKTHTDRLDLYASRSRKAFSATAAWRLELDAEKVEANLLELLDQLEKLKETTAKKTTETREEMSEAQRAAALKLLKSPGFLDTLSKHIEAIGYVGEDRNKKLTYVISSSRKLPKPLSAIVRSQSGAGKSYLMECVAELMPPEDVHFFSRLTPQALYYLERDALQHKLLIVDERNGSEESEYPIRTLQTRKVLKLAVPVKDPNSGRIKTETLEILGPISYMESTTSQKVNPENENRCFELYLDESDAQTRAIFAAQRKSRTLEGWKVERLKEKVRTLHHNAQRLLRPLKVIIPYVDLLEFPQSWLRGRRDHDRFLSLIEGIAFLHQYQRHIGEDNGQQYIEASVEDYAHAYDLAQTVFANTLGDLPKPVMDLLGQIRKMKKAEFTRRDVREFTKLPDHLVKRQMRILEELEYVSVSRAPSGGCFRYRLFSMEESGPALSGLTPPDELKDKAEQAGHDRNKAPVPL
jgi:DNA primase catalytic core